MAGLKVVPVKTHTDGNLDLEDLKKKAEKHHIDGLTGPQSIYANTTGLSFLTDAEQRVKGVQVKLEAQEKVLQAHEKGLKKLHDKDSAMQPGLETATEIRQRIVANYRKSKDERSADIEKMIETGNQAAHHCNISRDIVMRKLCKFDADIFGELYGIKHNTAESYLSIFSSPLHLLYVY